MLACARPDHLIVIALDFKLVLPVAFNDLHIVEMPFVQINRAYAVIRIPEHIKSFFSAVKYLLLLRYFFKHYKYMMRLTVGIGIHKHDARAVPVYLVIVHGLIVKIVARRFIAKI